MGTIWTPGGERPVGRPEPDASVPPRPRAVPDQAAGFEDEGELDDAAIAARMQELHEQLAATPVEAVVANHCYGLFELAALHLGMQPPQLDQSRLAIDALGALVEGLSGRLGEHEQSLSDGLAQLRLAFVQIRAAAQQGNPGGAAGT